LTASGLADPTRVAVSGASAGGFTALCALLAHGVFAAAVATSAITDLEGFRTGTHPFQAHETDRLVGPYPAQAAAYQQRSPLHHAADLTRPVLFLHGLRDPVVPAGQLTAMLAAMSAAGRHPQSHLFPDEGHIFCQPHNRAAALR